MTTPNTPGPASEAKQKVLDWVRSKNPQTMELKEGCKVKWNGDIMTIIGVQTHGMFKGMYQLSYRGETVGWECDVDEDGKDKQYDHAAFFDKPWETILGSDMGLQELLIALDTFTHAGANTRGEIVIPTKEHKPPYGKRIKYDLTKNLHSQSDDFYQNILPLLPQ